MSEKGKKSEKETERLKRVCLSKVAHKYLLSAQYALDRMTTLPNSIRLHIYTCPVCLFFHIGGTSDYQLKKNQRNKN
jgi:hypothetical protein